MQKIKDSFEKFHDYNCLIANRTIFFGKTGTFDDGDGDVGFESYKLFVKNLLFLDTLNHEEIVLYINTPGGDYYHGIAIYDFIKAVKSPVTAIGNGYLMSMGMIILQACTKRYVMPNCGMMVHDGYDGYCGDSKSFEAWGEESKYVRQKMYSIFSDRMKKKNKNITLKDIEYMCSHDKIIHPKEAIKLGLADKIISN